MAIRSKIELPNSSRLHGSCSSADLQRRTNLMVVWISVFFAAAVLGLLLFVARHLPLWLLACFMGTHISLLDLVWMPLRGTKDALDRVDPRVVRRKSDHSLRLISVSHLRVFRSPADGSSQWTPGPLLLPTSPGEEFGIGDARIVEIDAAYWITYVRRRVPSGRGNGAGFESRLCSLRTPRHYFLSRKQGRRHISATI